jgi:branched-chain amino acid transport system permease protein
MHWARSAELLLMVLLGGMASVLGPLAGAAAFMFLEEGLGLVTPHWPLLMGVILVLVVMYARNGLAELAGRLRRSARGAR